MTEDEAKKKMCPQSLSPISDGMGCITNCDCFCIGSQCMAWRWDVKPVDGLMNGIGYCGLAGKP